jgi:excisionase family DNA binding protein
MEEHLLDSLKVAEILHVSRSFAYLLMKRGDLPTVRIGNAIRVRATDLESFISEKELKKRTAPAFVRRRPR